MWKSFQLISFQISQYLPMN